MSEPVNDSVKRLVEGLQKALWRQSCDDHYRQVRENKHREQRRFRARWQGRVYLRHMDIWEPDLDEHFWEDLPDNDFTGWRYEVLQWLLGHGGPEFTIQHFYHAYVLGFPTREQSAAFRERWGKRR